jgi:Spy/CpxP family protein refolding chaperone
MPRRLVPLAPTLVLLLAAAPAPAGAADAGPRPVFHEEFGRALDEMGREVHGWTARFREHFGPGPVMTPTGERALISFMLAHRRELDLSPAQVAELERLRADFQREAVRREADLRVAEMDLAALRRQGGGDLAAVEAKIREIERLRADLRIAQVRTIEQGRAQLTAEQRERLRTLLEHPWPSRPRVGHGRPSERL